MLFIRFCYYVRMDTKYINMKKLNNAQIYALRRKVVNYKQLGRSNEYIAQTIRVNPRQIQKIWSAYLKSGGDIENLRLKSCGRKKESGKLLGSDEEQNILNILIETSPNQHLLDGLLWTREAVSELIKIKYGKLIPLRSVTNYLKQWKISYPKPNANYSLTQEEYLFLQTRAKSEHATIYWLGSHNISPQEQYVMTQSESSSWNIKHIPAQKPIDAFFAVPSKGTTRFLVVHDRNKQSRQIDFLRRLMVDTSNPKIIVILDGIYLDTGKRMQQFLNKNKERLEVILPAKSAK